MNGRREYQFERDCILRNLIAECLSLGPPEQSLTQGVSASSCLGLRSQGAGVMERGAGDGDGEGRSVGARLCRPAGQNCPPGGREEQSALLGKRPLCACRKQVLPFGQGILGILLPGYLEQDLERGAWAPGEYHRSAPHTSHPGGYICWKRARVGPGEREPRPGAPLLRSKGGSEKFRQENP